MPTKCSICNRVKGIRMCKIHDSDLICPQCCGENGGGQCEGCQYYEQGKRFQMLKEASSGQKKFFVELKEEIDKAVDRAMAAIERNKFSEAKENLRTRLRKLTDKLDRFLASEYGISEKKIPNINKLRETFEKWRKSHQPFHWFAELYGILKAGGFNVIIGNPPYVEYRKVLSEYSLGSARYLTLPAENLYAFCIERSADLLSSSGHFGMIVPSSAVGLQETLSVRQLLDQRYFRLFISTYSIRPSKLFDGVDQRLCIIL